MEPECPLGDVGSRSGSLTGPGPGLGRGGPAGQVKMGRFT